MKSTNTLSAGKFKTRQAKSSLIAGIFMPDENSLHNGKVVINGGGYGVEIGNKRLITANTNPIRFVRRKPAVSVLVEAMTVTFNDGFTSTLMEAVMPNITISSKEIREHNGLLSLNDLHKAAGGEQKHQPNKFLRLSQTKELEVEISKCPDVGNYKKVLRGKYGGTYVCEELFLAYAMWINAKTHLNAIHALREKHTGQANKPEPTNNSQQLALPDPNQTITIVTTIEPGKPPSSATYQGKVMLMPCAALLEYEKKMSHLIWDAERDTKALLVDFIKTAITAKSTPENTTGLLGQSAD